MDSKEQIYQNRDIILQYKMGDDRPTRVSRPQCPGQEDHGQIYENFDKRDSAYYSPDNSEMQMGGSYEILNKTVPPSSFPSTTRSAAQQPRINPTQKPRSQPSGNPISDKADVAKQEARGAARRRTQTSQQSNQQIAETKFAEKIEMQQVNESRKYPDTAPVTTQSHVNSNRIIVLSALAFIIALVALILAILLVAGKIGANNCNCMQDMKNLKKQVQQLQSQLSPGSTRPPVSATGTNHPPASTLETLSITKSVQPSFSLRRTTIKSLILKLMTPSLHVSSMKINSTSLPSSNIFEMRNSSMP